MGGVSRSAYAPRRTADDLSGSQPQEVMASRAHEQSEAGVGGGEKGSGRAQAHRAGAKGAGGGTADPGAAADARGCRWQEAGRSGQLDVLGAIGRAAGNHRRDGGLSPRQETRGRSAEGNGEQEARKGGFRGSLHGAAERQHHPRHRVQDPRGSTAGDQETGAGCIRSDAQRPGQAATAAQGRWCRGWR